MSAAHEVTVFPWEKSWRNTPGKERGFRHYLSEDGSRTLCGKDPDTWSFGDGPASCRTCLKAVGETENTSGRVPAPTPSQEQTDA